MARKSKIKSKAEIKSLKGLELSKNLNLDGNPNDELYYGIAKDSISSAIQSIQHIKTVNERGPVGINERARRHKRHSP